MKPVNSKAKVLIIFPRLSQSESSHYPYWYTLFNEAAKELDVVILFESASTNSNKLKTNFKLISEVVVQKQQQKPLNLTERYKLIKKYVNQGYTNIYIHYSYWSVILAWIIKKSTITHHPSPIKIYYWNCERFDTKPNDRLLNWCLRHIDVLVTGHQVIADNYRKAFNLGSKPIKIVPNWVNEERRTTNDESKNRDSSVPPRRTSHVARPNILFVHHLSPRKGSRELSTIITETLKQLPTAHFHIVGEGPDRKYLESRILNQGLEKEVTFYGSLSLNQVQGMFQTADLFIMPSRSEGFPRVILEAMINKTPFVATDVGCVKQIVSPSQLDYIVPPAQATRFAEALVGLSLLPTEKKKEITIANYQLCSSMFTLTQATRAFTRLFM